MIKKHRLILILMLTVLGQVACTSASPTMPAAACPTASADLKLMMNADDGYCLLYPADYSTDIPHFIVISPIPGPGDVLGDAWVSIDVEDAGSHTAAQVADAQIAEAGAGFNIT